MPLWTGQPAPVAVMRAAALAQLARGGRAQRPTHTNVTVRPAQEGDAAAISALNASVQQLHVAAHPEFFKPSSATSFPPAYVLEILAKQGERGLCGRSRRACRRLSLRRQHAGHGDQFHMVHLPASTSIISASSRPCRGRESGVHLIDAAKAYARRRIRSARWPSACGISTPRRGASSWGKGLWTITTACGCSWRDARAQASRERQHPCWQALPQPCSRQGWRRSQGWCAGGGKPGAPASLLASLAVAVQPPGMAALPGLVLQAGGQAGSASILAGKPCRSRAAARDGGAPRGRRRQAGSASILAGKPCRSRAAARDGGAPRGSASRERQHPCWQALP